MNSDWNDLFASLDKESFYLRLKQKIDEVYTLGTCYPPKEKMFAAFKECSLANLKVVIIGQDPYPNPGQAMGLSFSVPSGTPLPPSLKNIYKEIEDEGLGLMNYGDGDLTYLSHQGVLLLNTYLSVQAQQPASHAWKEYEEFMKRVLGFISRNKESVVFLFWGSFAKRFVSFADNPNHLKLFANHPSPLSANRGGWFGCNHFRLCNEYLAKRGYSPIDWCNGLIRL